MEHEAKLTPLINEGVLQEALTTIEKKVITLRYAENKTLEMIADELDVPDKTSRERVRQILRRAETELLTALFVMNNKSTE